MTKGLEEEGPRLMLTDEQLHYVLPTHIFLHKSTKMQVLKNLFQTLKRSISKLHQSIIKVSLPEHAIKNVSKICASLIKPKNISNTWSDVIYKIVKDVCVEEFSFAQSSSQIE